jgi:hypothetical protein
LTSHVRESATIGGAIFFFVVFPVLMTCQRWFENTIVPPKPLIDASIRNSLLDSKSGVLVLKNFSGRQLSTVSVHAQNLDSGQKTKYNIKSMSPDEVVELGLLEMNWKFIPHEEIRILYEDSRSSLEPTKATLKAVTHREDTYETYEATTGIIGLKRMRSEPVKKISAMVKEYD